MSLIPWNSFRSGNIEYLNEFDELETLIGGFEDLGLSEKRWSWSEIESAWHKIMWEGIFNFDVNHTISKLNCTLAGNNLRVEVYKPFSVTINQKVFIKYFTSNLQKIPSSGKRIESFTLNQILETLDKMARGFSIQYGQIEEIFVHLLDELRQDEKNPNLWLKLKVDLDPETDHAGNSNFRLSLSEMKVDPNWDQVADIMCDPRMLKEFKRNLYEKAGI